MCWPPKQFQWDWFRDLTLLSRRGWRWRWRRRRRSRRVSRTGGKRIRTTTTAKMASAAATRTTTGGDGTTPLPWKPTTKPEWSGSSAKERTSSACSCSGSTSTSTSASWSGDASTCRRRFRATVRRSSRTRGLQPAPRGHSIPLRQRITSVFCYRSDVGLQEQNNVDTIMIQSWYIYLWHLLQCWYKTLTQEIPTIVKTNVMMFTCRYSLGAQHLTCMQFDH